MLTPKQQRVVAAVARCRTIRAACRWAKVSDRAYRKWRSASEEFRDALKAAQGAVWSDAHGDLKGLSSLAVKVIGKLLKSPDQEVRRKTACWLLEHNLKVADHIDLTERLEAVEAAVAK